MIVGILGAKGFLGSALCCSFRAAGADYVPITRANYFVAPRTYDALIDADRKSVV